MKQTLILSLIAVLLLASGAFAFPSLFDVWAIDNGGPTLLGQISAYSDTVGHAANYNYYSASGHPINGPTPSAYTTNFWLYYNTTSQTMSFNLIHNVDNGGSSDWNYVSMDLYFNGMNYGVLLQDDDPENQGQGGFQDQGSGYMWADFAYKLNTDGGVVGIDPYDCCDWSIGIDPLSIGDISSINFGSGDGNNLTGWSMNAFYNPPDQEYEGPSFSITPHCEVPEPGTLMLLGMGLLTAGGVLRRRKK